LLNRKEKHKEDIMQEETQNYNINTQDVQGEAPLQNEARERQGIDTREQSTFDAAPEQSAPNTEAQWSVDQDQLLNPYEDDPSPIPKDQLLNPYEDDPSPIPEDQLLNPYEDEEGYEMNMNPYGGQDLETFSEGEDEGGGSSNSLSDLGSQGNLYAAVPDNSPGPFINNPAQPPIDPWDPPAPTTGSGGGYKGFPKSGDTPYGNVEGPDYTPPPVVEVPVEVVEDIVEDVGEAVGGIVEDIGDIFGS
jgi:hypothetical protein